MTTEPETLLTIDAEHPAVLVLTYRGRVTGTIVRVETIGPFTDPLEYDRAMRTVGKLERDRPPDRMRELVSVAGQRLTPPSEWILR